MYLTLSTNFLAHTLIFHQIKKPILVSPVGIFALFDRIWIRFLNFLINFLHLPQTAWTSHAEIQIPIIKVIPVFLTTVSWSKISIFDLCSTTRTDFCTITIFSHTNVDLLFIIIVSEFGYCWNGFRQRENQPMIIENVRFFFTAAYCLMRIFWLRWSTSTEK